MALPVNINRQTGKTGCIEKRKSSVVFKLSRMYLVIDSVHIALKIDFKRNP